MGCVFELIGILEETLDLFWFAEGWSKHSCVCVFMWSLFVERTLHSFC